MTYLDKIISFHSQRATNDSRDSAELAALAMSSAEPIGFAASISESNAAGKIAVIAEVKKASPSAGKFSGLALEPVADWAATYSQYGATCLSVLTDSEHFGGSSQDLTTAKAAAKIPALRKDFTVSLNDIYDARIMGADCVLLIVAALDDGQLLAFSKLASDLELDCLFEIHDEAELARIMPLSPKMVGINQRDLNTFKVDTDRAIRLATAIDDSALAVAESGIKNSKDVKELSQAGFNAVLIGESLVMHVNPAQYLAELSLVKLGEQLG